MVSLARFMVHAGERRVTGAYNVAYAPFRFREYLQAVLKVTGSNPRFHWIPEEFLAKHDVLPYRDIPLWRPRPVGSYRFDVSAAERAGLRNRPLEELIADELAGYRARHPDDGFRLSDSGAVSSELEQRIIAEWRGRKP
jgi:2'-hydroxyisoflavone reductase